MRPVKYALLFLSLWTSVVVAYRSSAEFAVALQPPSGPIKSGSEIRVKLTTTNISDHEIRFARGFGELESDFEIKVRDSQGQEPPPTESYRQLKEHPSSRSGSYSTYILEPGKSFDDDLVITKIYALTKPGKYTVSVTRGQRPMWQTQEKGWVKSNTVSVTVIP